MKRIITGTMAVLLAATPGLTNPRSFERLPPSQSDFGGVGLLQMPSARMAPEGEFSLHYSDVDPYQRLTITLQATEWLEATFGYNDIDNRLNSGPGVGTKNQTRKDKMYNIKLRLLEESRYLPQIAVGIRDGVGTGLFASEYLVASKRLWDFDLTAGVGWGDLAGRNTRRNPLTKLDDRFKERDTDTSGKGGQLETDAFFRGPNVGFFGGIEYQTPWQPLRLKVEFDSNSYADEPLGNVFKQDSKVNYGLVYRATDNIDIHAGHERGTTTMVGITARGNFHNKSKQVKFDPAADSLLPAPKAADWKAFAEALSATGFDVTRIDGIGQDIFIYGDQHRYRELEQEIRQLAPAVLNRLPERFEHINFVRETTGVSYATITIDRNALRDYTLQHAPTLTLSNAVPDVRPATTNTLYQKSLPERSGWSIMPSFRQSIGGVDRFYLYRVNLEAEAWYWLADNIELAGSLTTPLIGTFDKFDFRAPSGLPRVRTDINRYEQQSNVAIKELQLTRIDEIGDGWYGQLYSGMLERMFGGVGGEIMYRPNGSSAALSLDINWVKQRDFNGDFEFRDYDQWTGHLTAHMPLPNSTVNINLSFGRYLAGDTGIGIEVTKRFAGGVVAGAFADFTDVSSEAFGEGSFNKGIYFKIPLDAFAVKSSTRYFNFNITPLLRDGGQRLERRHVLYDMTGESVRVRSIVEADRARY